MSDQQGSPPTMVANEPSRRPAGDVVADVVVDPGECWSGTSGVWRRAAPRASRGGVGSAPRGTERAESGLRRVSSGDRGRAGLRSASGLRRVSSGDRGRATPCGFRPSARVERRPRSRRTPCEAQTPSHARYTGNQGGKPLTRHPPARRMPVRPALARITARSAHGQRRVRSCPRTDNRTLGPRSATSEKLSACG